MIYKRSLKGDFMKLLLLLSVLNLNSLALAATPDTHFVCGYQGTQNNLSIQFDGSRFVDFLNISLTHEEMKDLLHKSELSLETFSGGLRGFLQYGSCSKGIGNTLVTCSQVNANTVMYSFTKVEQLSPEFSQSINISRNLRIEKIALNVVNNNGRAQLDLRMTFSNFESTDIQTHIVKDLGALKPEAGGCKYTSLSH